MLPYRSTLSLMNQECPHKIFNDLFCIRLKFSLKTKVPK